MPLNRRSSGRQGGVHEFSAFEQLVVELVRHDDSWPFLKLVSKIQVTVESRAAESWLGMMMMMVMKNRQKIRMKIFMGLFNTNWKGFGTQYNRHYCDHQYSFMNV